MLRHHFWHEESRQKTNQAFTQDFPYFPVIQADIYSSHLCPSIEARRSRFLRFSIYIAIKQSRAAFLLRPDCQILRLVVLPVVIAGAGMKGRSMVPQGIENRK